MSFFFNEEEMEILVAADFDAYYCHKADTDHYGVAVAEKEIPGNGHTLCAFHENLVLYVFKRENTGKYGFLLISSLGGHELEPYLYQRIDQEIDPIPALIIHKRYPCYKDDYESFQSMLYGVFSLLINQDFYETREKQNPLNIQYHKERNDFTFLERLELALEGFCNIGYTEYPYMYRQEEKEDVGNIECQIHKKDFHSYLVRVCIDENMSEQDGFVNLTSAIIYANDNLDRLIFNAQFSQEINSHSYEHNKK